ncbi:SPOR domain-containing protein [Albidovulum sediminis]|uniref:SPOR domain-containing protein n=1 Tax=Albidovulum sediminis TaxID=3066345 RepID=A0ABT2NNH5_9RHOB|nr:SPOR domain-containing protein [Defluviimonas sediminis]MCT8329638.1 SPOR domain-containing protein [Defluviimonas sediminis]
MRSGLRQWLVAMMAGAMATAAVAVPVTEVDGPAEPPPDGYAERQFVDSQGCMFARVTAADGSLSWAPVATPAGELLCGHKPSVTLNMSVTAPAAAPEPVPSAPAPEPTAEPEQSATEPMTEPAAPEPTPVPAAPQAAPEPDPVAARPADAPASSPRDPVRLLEIARVPLAATHCATGAAEAEVYLLSDGRRAVRCSGPAEDPLAALVANGYLTAPRRVPEPPEGARHLQVGAFAQAANADRMEALAVRLGFPVERREGRGASGPLTLVLIGPFAQAQDLRAAWRAFRTAGHSDAYYR